MRACEHQGRDGQHIAADNRPRFTHVDVNVDVALEPQALHRFRTAGADFFVTRPLIDDGRIVIRDVGDVGRLVDDGEVLLGWDNGSLHSRSAKRTRLDETIVLRTDVVVAIGPVVNAGAAVEPRFRRQRSPAYVAVAFAP